MKKPNRYNSDFTHMEFGIRNWLTRIDITKKDEQDDMINMFCKDNGFNEGNMNSRNLRIAKYSFIDKRFRVFITYVQKNYHLYLKYS